jgi:DNA-binding response OmpR family regulator
MTGRIAVLEDNVDCCQILQLLFAPEFPVDTFDRVEKLKQAMLRTRYDVLITDLMLEGEFAGTDILNFVRTTSTLSNMPVILLTGDSVRFNAETAAKRGFDGYILKPFEFDELRYLVGKLTGREMLPFRAAA